MRNKCLRRALVAAIFVLTSVEGVGCDKKDGTQAKAVGGSHNERASAEEASAIQGMAKKSDLEGLQGLWIAPSVGQYEKKIDNLSFSADSFQWGSIAGKFALSPDARPKQIDLTFTNGGRQSVVRGIYELRDGEFKLAFYRGGDGRPADLSPPTTSDQKEATTRTVGEKTYLIFRAGRESDRYLGEWEGKDCGMTITKDGELFVLDVWRGAGARQGLLGKHIGKFVNGSLELDNAFLGKANLSSDATKIYWSGTEWQRTKL